MREPGSELWRTRKKIEGKRSTAHRSHFATRLGAPTFVTSVNILGTILKWFTRRGDTSVDYVARRWRYVGAFVSVLFDGGIVSMMYASSSSTRAFTKAMVPAIKYAPFATRWGRGILERAWTSTKLLLAGGFDSEKIGVFRPS